MFGGPFFNLVHFEAPNHGGWSSLWSQSIYTQEFMKVKVIVPKKCPQTHLERPLLTIRFSMLHKFLDISTETTNKCTVFTVIVMM